MIHSFKTAAEFRHWLAKNQGRNEGLWIKHFKKGAGIPTISYAEALDECLCQGWIDAQKKSFDKDSWLQRYCPRRPKSKWSKTNQGHVRRLTKAGRMKKPGLDAVLAAKKDGRWEAAYDSPSKAVLPKDFLRALQKNKKAKAFFESLNRANVYAISYRIQTAKRPETRQRWIERIMEMLETGKKFHE